MKHGTIKPAVCAAFVMTVAMPAAAQNMREVLRMMPDSIMPLLTRNDRLDHIDYFESNVPAEVKDRFGTPTRMLALTDDYALLHTSGSSDVALKLLERSDGSRLTCVLTTCTVDSVADTSVRIYTADWQLLNTALLLPVGTTDDFTEIRFAENASDLTVTHVRPHLTPAGDPQLPDERSVATWRWTGTAFERPE